MWDIPECLGIGWHRRQIEGNWEGGISITGDRSPEKELFSRSGIFLVLKPTSQLWHSLLTLFSSWAPESHVLNGIDLSLNPPAAQMRYALCS